MLHPGDHQRSCRQVREAVVEVLASADSQRISSRAVALTCLLIALTLAAACSGAGPRVVILATTTSVGNSGLLDVLTAGYREDRGVIVRAHLVGSGRALAMLTDGAADAVISHAPTAEALALARHPGWTYAKLMFNDFVIVGPGKDPAGVRGASSAEDAFKRIAGSGMRFISRGDSSGTHERERLLWQLAGVTPSANHLVVAGQAMGATLRIADQTMAYTLTDRATFAQNASSVQLRILFGGGPRLLNTYAVIYDSRATEPRAFAEWLIAGKGKELIARYRVAGVAVFTPWPDGQPRSAPDSLPR
jgi:tungstate transport system substrate-binding protein